MNGPVASAGSILYLSNSRGIKVPKIAAKMTTVNKDMLTTNPNVALSKTNAMP